LEDSSELRELPNLEGSFGDAAAEEVDCFLGVVAVSDVKPLDGNHSDDCREYFGRNTGFRGETYADCRSARPAVLLPILGVNYLTRFFKTEWFQGRFTSTACWKGFLPAVRKAIASVNTHPLFPMGQVSHAADKTGPAICRHTLSGGHSMSKGKIRYKCFSVTK